MEVCDAFGFPRDMKSSSSDWSSPAPSTPNSDLIFFGCAVNISANRWAVLTSGLGALTAFALPFFSGSYASSSFWRRPLPPPAPIFLETRRAVLRMLVRISASRPSWVSHSRAKASRSLHQRSFSFSASSSSYSALLAAIWPLSFSRRSAVRDQMAIYANKVRFTGRSKHCHLPGRGLGLAPRNILQANNHSLWTRRRYRRRLPRLPL